MQVRDVEEGQVLRFDICGERLEIERVRFEGVLREPLRDFEEAQEISNKIGHGSVRVVRARTSCPGGVTGTIGAGASARSKRLFTPSLLKASTKGFAEKRRPAR